MSRFLAIPLTLLVLVPALPAGELPVAPPPRAVTPHVAVAPFPHVPGEAGLALEDVGIDPTVPKIDVERIPDVTVPGPVSPNDPIGLPDLKVPTTLPGRLIPPASVAADEPVLPGFNPGDPNKLPSGPFAGRNPANRAKFLKLHGGSDDSEKAVALGLAWLAQQQKKDGSWEFEVGMKEKKAAATAFALLCFLGAGETHKPVNKEKEERKYQKTVKAGLEWLGRLVPVNSPNSGRISSEMYEQAIATLALCEAYAMTKDATYKPMVQAAVNYIQRAQGPNGSWGYSAGANGDVSIVGWQVQALYAAKTSKDIVVDDKVIAKAIKFLDAASAGGAKAIYGYADNKGAAAGTALTASGLWSRCCLDNWGPDNAGLKEGVAGLLKNPPRKTGGITNLYYYYYATLVTKGFGGEEWKTWNEGPKQGDGRKGGMRDWLIGQQIKKEGANLGSWDPDAGFIGTSCGRLGTTALCVLNLEVYYRYGLPDKKEDKKGDKK